MAKNHGCVSIDDLAGQAGLSARQFRRRCVEMAGLAPKFLARVFASAARSSTSRAHPCAFARLALDCGY